MKPLELQNSEKVKSICQDQFLHQPWQLVQSVTLYAPQGRVRNAITVLQVHPKQERIECLITSLEGIVLLEAEYDAGPNILRALPPFQDQEFARTLFRDVRAVLFPPEPGAIEIGKTAAGVLACEYPQEGAGLVRVLLQDGGQREIMQYSREGKHLQTIEASYSKPVSKHQFAKDQKKIPEKLVIQNHSAWGYKLELELIEAKTLD